MNMIETIGWHTHKKHNVSNIHRFDRNTMKNIILFSLLLLLFGFNDFFFVSFLNCRLENEYNNNNALLAIVVVYKIMTKKNNQ